MSELRSCKAALLAAVAALGSPMVAPAAQYFYAGYDTTNSVAGTVDAPVSGFFATTSGNTFFSDAAGTVPYGSNVAPASSGATEIYFGGVSTSTNYTVTANASTTTSTSQVALNVLVLNANNGGNDIWAINYKAAGKGCFSFAANTSGSGGDVGGAAFTPGIIQNGNTNWTFANPLGATAPLRLLADATIRGSGSGNISIPFVIAQQSGNNDLTVDLTGGATLQLGGTNLFGGGTNHAFVLNHGTVDFTNSQALGNPANQIRLNGGTLLSTTGKTLSTYTGGVLLGGDVALAGGSTAWGLGTSAVTLTGNRTLTANNTGVTGTAVTGTTIDGVISDTGAGYGITVASTSATPGTLTLTGQNTYTGTTTVTTGNLVLGPNAQAPVLTGPGGADLAGTGKMQLSYAAGASPVAAIQTMLNTEYAANGGNFTTGQIRSSTAAALGRTIGYADNGTDTVTLRQTLPGDANLDGVVNFSDFLLLQANFGGSGTTFGQGNFNYDGATNFSDFLLLQANFGSSINGTAVAVTAGEIAALNAFATANATPEPASLAAAAMVGLLGLRRRRATT